MRNKKFTREVILRAPQFAKYQPDFLGVILDRPEYTIAEARKIAEAYFKKESD